MSSRSREKPLINLVIAGHVDHGKSTLIGRLLFELGLVSQRKLEDMRQEAKCFGKDSYFYAYLLDQSSVERDRGNTIELSFLEPFDTGANIIKIVDTPGHPDFMSNMLTGASQADAAVVVVDPVELLTKGLKPTAETRGLDGLREHLLALRFFGVLQMIVAINKMDRVDYKEEPFRRSVEQLSEYLKEIEFDLSGVTFVPVSAFKGENVTKRSSEMGWYKGPTFLEALQQLKEPPRPVDKPFRLPITRTFLNGRIPVGVVVSGTVHVGDKVVIAPVGKEGTVQSIEEWKKRVPQATVGEDVGLMLKGVGRQYLRRGFVIGDAANPPRSAKKIRARIVVLNPRGLWVGYGPTIYCHTTRALCRVVKLFGKDGEERSSLNERETGEAEIHIFTESRKGIAMEVYREFPALGRFALKDGTQTVAVGICTQIIE